MPDINEGFEDSVEARLAATTPNKGQIELPSDAVLLQHWKNFGGEVHGPRVETVTMPESQFYPFMRHMLTLMFLEGVKAIVTPVVKPGTKKAFVPISDSGLHIQVCSEYENQQDPLIEVIFDGNVNATYDTISSIFNKWFGKGAFEKLHHWGKMACGNPKVGWVIFIHQSQIEAYFTRQKEK